MTDEKAKAACGYHETEEGGSVHQPTCAECIEAESQAGTYGGEPSNPSDEATFDYATQTTEADTTQEQTTEEESNQEPERLSARSKRKR